jgi:hypothetical protein
MRALGGFLAGLSLALLTTCGSSAPAYADRVGVECHPVVKPDVVCGNALKMYFETKGHVPLECKVS